MNRALRRWAPLLAVAGLLVAAWATAVLSSPELNNVPVPPVRVDGRVPTAQPTRDASASPSSPAPSNQTEVELPDERNGLIGIVTLTIVVLVGGLVTWILVRKRVLRTKGGPLVVQRPGVTRKSSGAGTDAVVEAIDAGLTDLSDTDADPRRAVIACWVRLERAAAAAGTPRHIGDSPTDLVFRLLHEQRISQGVLNSFASVYREARFATHAIDERTRTVAVEALRQVRSELGERVRYQRPVEYAEPIRRAEPAGQPARRAEPAGQPGRGGGRR